MSDGPGYLDDIHQDIAEFAERHLDEEERADFVDALLERKGYTRTSSWAPPEPQQGQGGGRQPLVRQRAPAKQGAGGQGGQQGKRSYFK